VLTISPWWLLAAAVPILLLGEQLVRHIPGLARFDVPPPIAGGFLIAITLLAINTRATHVDLKTKTSSPAWSWLITPEAQWRTSPAVPIFLPFSTAFFTCVGLNASWRIARQGSRQLLLFLALATLLGILQNLLGLALAKPLHASPYLGVLCGSVTLTGGPSTALGFAPEFEKAGFPAAATVGAAAAMFGILTGSLLAGAIGGLLIRRHNLRSAIPLATTPEPQHRRFIGFIPKLLSLLRDPARLAAHILILLACMKLGAWVSYALQSAHLSFPVYMGAMLTGIAVRNLLDALHLPLIDTAFTDRLGSIVLAIFLAVAMSSLNLLELRPLAGPMLAILTAQVFLTLAFAYWLTFAFMGRDYDAAITSAGHVGFGLGITPNSVATMDTLTQKFGPAPRALLIVTTVGAFLIDLTNSLTITAFLNFIKPAR